MPLLPSVSVAGARLEGSPSCPRLPHAKNAFSALSHFLQSQVEEGTFPCEAGKVTSLWSSRCQECCGGLKVALSFFVSKFGPVLFSRLSTLLLHPLKLCPSCLSRRSSHRAPLRESFLCAFPVAPLGSGSFFSSSKSSIFGWTPRTLVWGARWLCCACLLLFLVTVSRL
jgi:hypothetical protein